MPFSTIEHAIAAFAEGKMLVVVDDEHRENEGDVIVAAEKVTPEAIAFMMREARGLICTSLPASRLEELAIPLMVSENTETMRTAFTVSIDLREGISTGISAADRARTIRALLDPSIRPEGFARPGHVFPLRAQKNGVLARPGHTEASADLARLAGLSAAGVLCEIANDDGTMARLPELERFAEKHGLRLISIADLIAYRRRTETFVSRVSEAQLPTKFGQFTAYAYRDNLTGHEHLALVTGNTQDDGLPVRVHSECLTGDVLASSKCDCGDQLDLAMTIVQQAQRGCIIYLRGQEGRGIGLANKIATYALQDTGLDTLEANTALGLPSDSRDYLAAVGILKDLNLDNITLLTNNPFKVAALRECGIQVNARRSLITAAHAANINYLRTKQNRFGHQLELA
ncbi:bifunctional 3,4-dihydroxy-2-butanone-4-phosphate synthase/GTP cyclohydrolase II [Mesorhizobium sp. B2-4-14]|uniref:bifunctional 3,4-dihydroxy-2-butanone-4-phosphate synthase/GTP cyclohydrolase II n=1 Tax=Mesorhizobium sp. B2-4-14 TaxID=2589935 RepID=UPI00112872C5|nr:bifunctional 3,4-dihydroxy-2-butanone-4-phosphate synthase/GTP cyclohydrolase II [Mesorhizobium sp. B2-4-14]TPK99857.1 bifunctional 3,4-dihydroxy-2-butanone-4-phosphate synthase/GTP cyclohydrolase II [Mesorhizobium sp. B2-4-14]